MSHPPYHGRARALALRSGRAARRGACRSCRTRFATLALIALAPTLAHGDAPAKSNIFNDPFVQASNGMPGCPVPQGPLLKPDEAKAQSHLRAEKGTTCWYYGRCRLPNAYLYDAEIVPRVARFISLTPRFATSSVWLLGQRRWIYLKGCMPTQAMAKDLRREVRLIDDVEAVVDELMVGTTGRPPYAVARP